MAHSRHGWARSQCSRLRAAQGGINGKSPRVGEGVQHFHARPAPFPHPAAVVALVQKDSLGVTRGHVQPEQNALFLRLKLQGKDRSGNLDGHLLLILFQTLVKYGNIKSSELLPQIHGNGTVTRGNQNAISQAVHKHVRIAIPFPVNHAENISTRGNQSFLVFQAMAVRAAHGTERLRNLTAGGNGKSRENGF